MNENYLTIVDGEHEFEISNEEIKNLDIIQQDYNDCHLLLSNTSYRTQLLSSNFNDKTYRIRIDGRVFKINIHTPLDILIAEMGLSAVSEKNINVLIAPMPGLVIDILVNNKDEVKENDPMLILEAMKMENVMVAPRDGTIKSISVNRGQSVDKNDLLIEFE